MLLIRRELFAQLLTHNKTKYVGNVIGNGFNIPANFDDYWNQVTPENAGKWGSVEGGRDNYNWTQLANVYNYTRNNNLFYKHHTLIWGNQQPGWISGLDSASQYEEVVIWISLVGERYPDADFCDVVNESLNAPPPYKEALGSDGETGWDWVITSFELARKYLSPNTKLHLNEYSVINSNSANANFIEIINLLKDEGLIDGIGVQGHNFEVNGDASVSTLVDNFTNLAATGLPIYITEFDIKEADDNVQLMKYQTIFPPIYEHPEVFDITFWGYIEFMIWQTDAYLLTERYAERPELIWFRSYLAAPFIPEPFFPVDTTDINRNATMIWTQSSDSATAYHTQIATSNAFTNIVVDNTIADTLIQLNPLEANTVSYWHVSALNEQAEISFSDYAYFVTINDIMNAENMEESPTDYSLSQNYLNPFNTSTTIEFTLPTNGDIIITLYDILGNYVDEIVRGTLIRVSIQ